MNILIRGDHLAVTEALKDYVENRFAHLKKFDEAACSEVCRVTMRVLRGQHTVEATIPAGGIIFRAEESADDMYAAIDLVVEKLLRQFRDYKNRTKGIFRQRKGMKHFANQAEHISQPFQFESEEDDLNRFGITRVKRFELKPMDVEEAVLQMEMLGHNFFIFTNTETEEVNVVYKRKDGQYGLIESA